MTAKHWFILSVVLVFVGPWVIGYMALNLLDGRGSWGLVVGFMLLGLKVIAIPVFILFAGVAASFAFMRRGIKPAAQDDSTPDRGLEVDESGR